MVHGVDGLQQRRIVRGHHSHQRGPAVLALEALDFLARLGTHLLFGRVGDQGHATPPLTLVPTTAEPWWRRSARQLLAGRRRCYYSTNASQVKYTPEKQFMAS